MARDRVQLDATNLRGLAHPIRVKILGALRLDGSSTATRLASRLGLSSAATSYHLRQLAAYGFVVEDETAERSHGKERWWQAAHSMTVLDEHSIDPEDAETTAIADEYLRVIARTYTERIAGSLDDLPNTPEAWRNVGTISDIVLRLTPDEASALQDQIQDLLLEQRRDEPNARGPRGSRRVAVQWQVLPDLERK
jgi:DNA-binding transcriptional ArsR family regulator